MFIYTDACSGYCSVPPNPTCQESICNIYEGVCEIYVKHPLPQNCCKGTIDCLEQIEDDNNNNCIQASCNLLENMCEFEDICNGSGPIQSCTDSRDCRDDDDICSIEKCIDGFCRTSKNPNVENSNCCQVAQDCPETPCKTAYCSSNFRCGYFPIQGCEISSIFSEFNEATPTTNEYLTSVSYTSYEKTSDPNAGDIVGMVIGLVALAILVIAFLIVIVITAIHKEKDK